MQKPVPSPRYPLKPVLKQGTQPSTDPPAFPFSSPSSFPCLSRNPYSFSQQVSLIGHSAGAQLVMMALLQRAAALKMGSGGSHQTHTPLDPSRTPQDTPPDPRMPLRMIGATLLSREAKMRFIILNVYSALKGGFCCYCTDVHYTLFSHTNKTDLAIHPAWLNQRLLKRTTRRGTSKLSNRIVE